MSVQPRHSLSSTLPLTGFAPGRHGAPGGRGMAVRHAAAIVAGCALLAFPAAAQADSTVSHLSGAWKATVSIQELTGKIQKHKGTIHLQEDGTAVSGAMPIKYGSCGVVLNTLVGVTDGTQMSFTVQMPDLSGTSCAVLCTSTFDGTVLFLDAVHASGDGEFLACDPGGSPDLLAVPKVLMVKVSGMQTPTDPDGDGPAVTLSQMGSGEPGLEGAHDLAVTGLKAPGHVLLTSAKPTATRKVFVQIQNRGQHTETFNTLGMLEDAVELEVEALSALGPPATALPQVTMVAPPKFPLELKPKAKRIIAFEVTFDDAVDPAATTPAANHDDYRYIATVHHEALPGADADDHPDDDAAPRGSLAPWDFDSYPDGTIKDRGVGTKLPDGTLGGDVVTDVVIG